MPVAYSIDLERTVDVEEAYELFWEGHILAKQNFECADENCDIQITAANLDKLRENMKRDPFYTTRNLHSKLCGFNPINIKSSSTKLASKKRSVEKSPSVHFCTTRPKSHYQVKKNSKPPSDTNNSKQNAQDRKQRKKNDLETRPETPRRYSITPLVSHYSNIRDSEQSGSEIIETDKFSISFDEMFVLINNQLASEQSTFWRIYYGKANVIKLKNDQFLIKFHDAFEYQDKLINPSLFIQNWLLEKAFNKKLKENKLDHYSSKREPAWVFVYSAPESILSKNGDQHLNLNIKTMDFFDLRDNF